MAKEELDESVKKILGTGLDNQNPEKQALFV